MTKKQKNTSDDTRRALLDERESRLAIEAAELELGRQLQERADVFRRREAELRLADAREYAAECVAAEQLAGTIAPQFVSYITGDSVEQVELAIDQAKMRTSEIPTEIAGQRERQAQQRDEQGRFQGQPQQQPPETDYTDLSLSDYVRLRNNPGMPGTVNQEGLFQ